MSLNPEHQNFKKWLIWSIEHNAWWAPSSKGYVNTHLKAGLYSQEEAFALASRGNYMRLNEVPVPACFFSYQQDFHDFMEVGE